MTQARVFREPVVFVSIEPKSPADANILANALSRLREEDLTFRIQRKDGKTIISGMAELHLEILVDRLKREAELIVSRPQVIYKETIRAERVEEGKFVRETRDGRQSGYCSLRLEPLPPGSGFEFVDIAPKISIPTRFRDAIKKGVREALAAGPLAGFPVTDIKITLFNGAHKEGESDEEGYQTAARLATQAGMKTASPTLLEPIMKFEVKAPKGAMDDVIADLKARRATVFETWDESQISCVKGTVPVGELFGYSHAFRSITLGRGSYTLEPSHFDKLPWHTYKTRIAPRGSDEPPTSSAGRPVLPVRPKPGISGSARRKLPPGEN